MATAPRRLGERTTTAERLPQVRTREPRVYSHRWRRLSDKFAAVFPLCVLCVCRGKLGRDARRAGRARNVVVDHVEPFTTAPDPTASMYDWSNLQSLCARCHDSDKQRIERRTPVGAVRATWLRYLREEMGEHLSAEHVRGLREHLPDWIAYALLEVMSEVPRAAAASAFNR